VFVYEWLAITRRWQLYAIRAAFVGVVLSGMTVAWQNSHHSVGPGQIISIQTLAQYGENLYETVVSVELTLVLLAAPAVTAGAVCLDKARGTLDHVLATDLSNSEIVLGKLGVRLIPVLGLIACTLPITALANLLGGIDPQALWGSFLTATACAALGCSLALTLSIWGRKTHEVLMMTYLILIIWLTCPLVTLMIASSLSSTSRLAPWSLVPGLWQWLKCSNPYYLAFAPYTDPANISAVTYLGFLGICLAIAALFMTLATLWVRSVSLKQAGQSTALIQSSWPTLAVCQLLWLPAFGGPSLDGNPVLWREWHRLQPSRFRRAVWLLYTALGILWLALSIHLVTNDRGNEEVVAMMTVFQVLAGLLLISVSAATSLAEERARGSLDVLLATPLSTRSILSGKWWGSFRVAAWVLVWPAILAGLLVIESGYWFRYTLLLGLILAYSAVITSLGLALATWVSRLGRAVALCACAYVLFSIGWVVLVFFFAEPSRTSDHFILPLVMGSPFYGVFFSTLAVAPGPHHGPGGEADVWAGAVLWISIHASAAAVVFAATLATFDRCLGRVSETAEDTIPNYRKKGLSAVDLDLDDWIAESPVME
jgi:ABC-type transport system involved in multi-copper enzyme maturation permease subunit